MKRAERAAAILERLRAAFPDPRCALDHENAYQLVAATILSAQCTDERVNMVTPVLFERYPTPHDLAEAATEDVEEIIRSTGFFRNKTKSLIGMASRVVEDFGGEVPRTMEELLTLPGVARKTANVVLGNAFGKNVGVVVDTHVGRLTRLMGLTRQTDPVKVEKDLMKLFPRGEWTNLSHRLILHGRAICIARRPQCAACVLGPDLCPAWDPDPGAWKRKFKKAGKKAAGKAKTTRKKKPGKKAGKTKTKTKTKTKKVSSSSRASAARSRTRTKSRSRKRT